MLDCKPWAEEVELDRPPACSPVVLFSCLLSFAELPRSGAVDGGVVRDRAPAGGAPLRGDLQRRAAPRPRDACRAYAVSPAFRAAADSDAVWASFLPRDVPNLADGELSPAPPSKKELFLRLSGSDGPLLLPDRLRGMWFDRETGAKCYVLSARALVINRGDTSDYWRWIPLADSSFAEAAEFMNPCRMEIRGKIDSMVLTPNSTYTAFMVFKIADELYELDTPPPPQEATISIGENESRREVAFTRSMPRSIKRISPSSFPPEDNATYPLRRADGWMEVELGEFFNDDGEDGAVYMRLMSKEPNWMRGLIVLGIEIRMKRSGR